MTKELLKLSQRASVIAAHHPEVINLIKKICTTILSQSKKSSTSAIKASLPAYPSINLNSITSHATPAIKPTVPTPIANTHEVRALTKFQHPPVRHFSHSKTIFSNKKEDKTGISFDTRIGSSSGLNSGIVYKPFEKIEIKNGNLNYKFYEDDKWVFGTDGVDYKFNSCKIL